MPFILNMIIASEEVKDEDEEEKEEEEDMVLFYSLSGTPYACHYGGSGEIVFILYRHSVSLFVFWEGVLFFYFVFFCIYGGGGGRCELQFPSNILKRRSPVLQPVLSPLPDSSAHTPTPPPLVPQPSK